MAVLYHVAKDMSVMLKSFSRVTHSSRDSLSIRPFTQSSTPSTLSRSTRSKFLGLNEESLPALQVQSVDVWVVVCPLASGSSASIDR